jgi:TorA maturation chaperone TorD
MTEIEARRILYRFLAQCYTYPEPAFCKILCRGDIWDWVAEAGHRLSRQTDQIIADLQACAACAPDGDERLHATLEVEYTYLFINAPRGRAAGSQRSVPAPPYESAYTGTGLLMGEPVSQVLAAYRQAGLAIRDDYDALPDHVAAELEFVAYLIRQEAEAARRSVAETAVWQARQGEFLAGHLLCWGPAFLASVQAHARRAFYARVAGLTGALLDAEGRRFGLV